ncbi:hypothetical protein L3Q82_017087 [Scortum barcoo]|uniref:Uncharacterized protein n=1 Tax=Scortum barcoo TaxID=214431 RepID=A0ACB8X958_9TELE|nr:hypothetical protein L3Q82_017087 [Scortum barcoo]
MIDFVVVSSDLRPYVLDTRVKRGAELSTDHHLVVSWIRWQRRKLDRPGRPKRIVRVCWERIWPSPLSGRSSTPTSGRASHRFRGRLGDIESEWTMFSASIVDAAVRKLWTQGLWCLSWRQSPNPVVDTGIDRYQQAKQAAARTVLEAKTRVWEEFGEAMEEDYRSASKRFWQTVRRLRRGKQYSANTVYSAGGELLTSTGDIVGRWKKYFEDLLNPTDLPSNEEAEAGVSEVDSSITQAEVTEVVRKLLEWQGAGASPGRSLRQGTGEENSADSRPLGFRRNNAVLVFVLVVEHWTSSIPSTGCLRVYGSLPNQSTCALWIWRRHSTVSLVVFCGECSASMGSGEPLLRAVRSLYDRSRSLVRIAGSQDLQHVLERFAAECEAAGMRISTSKSPRPWFSTEEKGGMPSPGGWRGPASSGGVQVSRGLVHE